MLPITFEYNPHYYEVSVILAALPRINILRHTTTEQRGITTFDLNSLLPRSVMG